MVNEDGQSPLHAAAIIQDSPEMVSAIIKASDNVNLQDTSSASTPLTLSLDYNSNTETVVAFIKNGVNVNTSGNGFAPLFHALDREGYGFNDCLKITTELIEAGADVNATFFDGEFQWTVLEYALSNSSTEMVMALIRNGVNVNAPGNDGFAPLFHALDREAYGFNDGLEITTTLIEAGADVNATFFDGEFQWSVLEYALSNSNTEMVMALIRNGVNVNAPADYNPLFHALDRESYGFNDCLKITTALIEAGADVNATFFDGEFQWTVLEWASAEPASSSEVITMLIKAGAR